MNLWHRVFGPHKEKPKMDGEEREHQAKKQARDSVQEAKLQHAEEHVAGALEQVRRVEELARENK